MCSIAGFANFEKDISKNKNILLNMNKVLRKRGPDEDGVFCSPHIMLAHKRLIVIDPDGGKQPMTEKFEENEYVITYNGQIYNFKELRKTLLSNGFNFNTNSDTEVLLKAFIYYGNRVVNYLNGIFAFAIYNKNKEELFLARDHFGVKPLFYTTLQNTFIFASEIKGLFEYPGIKPKMNSQGICELLGIGPCHTPGTTVFSDIFELKPAHFAIFNKSGLHLERYWKLESKEHTENLGRTCERVSYLLNDAITKQLVSDVPICSFLSGGLDSSIISKFAANYCKDNDLQPLKTFSVTYVDNDKNFVKNDFQPNSDTYYIELMNKNLYNEHKTIILDTPELANYLEEAMIARDMPGMADIDSSLLLFCKNAKQDVTVALTGECADEIFAGYPWFFRKDALNSNTFPWSIAISERQQLLNSEISNKVNLKEYVDFRYNESLNEIEFLESDSEETKQKRKISYLTMNWFMQTLLDRSDRMAMYNGFELRVPFCDYRLAQYMWNVPWELKALNGREKGLLRYMCRDFLPAEIVDRKKSPYPKTHNPTYTKKVKEMLNSIMQDTNAPVNNLLDRNYILEILNTEGKAFSRPWFGQLMTGPQLMAYICQVNMWLTKYNPEIIL